MTTYPLATLAPTVGPTGISAPSYSDVLLSLQASFNQIYGSDIYIAADSQDGQWLGVLAKAISDSNQVAIAIFQSFSPTYAQGAQLSSLVKINGLTRNSSGYSTVTGTVTGTVGSAITNGIVKDNSGNLWSLPPSVVIPSGGSINETITCQTAGSVPAPYSTTTWSIVNPQLGWQGFSTSVDATIGAAVESDAALRIRQAVSTSLPSQTVMDGILGAVANVPGVVGYFAYENSTASALAVDSIGNTIPAHSIAIVVSGGSLQPIVDAIALKKPPGVQTYGALSGTHTDAIGMTSTINYSSLASTAINFAFTIVPLTGYVSTTKALIIAALSNFIDSLAIGENVYATQALAVASLPGNPLGLTFSITMSTFFQGTSTPTTNATINIAWNATATIGTITITGG